MLFLTPGRAGSASQGFAERELVWRSYTAAESMLTTWRVEINYEKEFAAATFVAASVLLISV